MKKQFLKRIKGLVIAAILLGLIGAQINLFAFETPINSMVTSAYAEEPADDENKPWSPYGDGVAAPKSPVDIQKLVDDVAKLSTYVNKIFNPLIHFFTLHIGNLLNNDYIFADKMGEMLQNIWRLSRNIVNIAFVLVLLYLALKHIFSGEGEGNTDLKKILPSFAIMLLAVNFSWMVSKIVLDAANVTANIAFSIPAGVKGILGENLNYQSCTIDDLGRVDGMCAIDRIYYPFDAEKTDNVTAEKCKELKLDEIYTRLNPPSKIDDEGKKVDGEPTPQGDDKLWEKRGTLCWKTIDFADYNQNNASYFLSFSMARVQNLTQASNQGIAKTAIGLTFALIIQVVYIVAFGSLFIAMVFRIAILWALMAFSPFLVLLFFLKNHLQEASFESETFSISTFTQWAFAPAKVGAIWSIGFIMVSTGQAISVDFAARAADGVNVSSKLFQVNSLFMGMDSLQQFMWLLMTTIIIWMGTFSVLTKLKGAEGIFGRINEYGKAVAMKVAESPTWAPIMPLYDFKKGSWSLGSLASVDGPNKILDDLKLKYTNNRDAITFSQAEGKLKRMDDRQTREFSNVLAGESTGKMGELAVRFFTDHAGLTEEQIRSNPTLFRQALNAMDGPIKENAKKLAPAVENYLKGKPASTPSTPAAPLPQTATPPPQAGGANAPAAAAGGGQAAAVGNGGAGAAPAGGNPPTTGTPTGP